MRTRVYVLVSGIILTIFVCVFLGYRQYLRSLFSNPLNRINVGIWGKHTYIVSLSNNSTQNYLILFDSTQMIQIPGGLKGYKVGSLGKLASLEQDIQVYKKALGVGGNTFLHRTLFENTDTIYYDERWMEGLSFEQFQNELKSFVFLSGDMSIFDRVFYYQAISRLKPSNTTVVKSAQTTSDVVLFDKTFRNERKLVQIMYQNSERTAMLLARTLENTGIRIADISRKDRGEDKECVVTEQTIPFSRTARFISDFFACKMVEGDTGLYDLRWYLGNEVEERWKW